jgi:hypothetical protein
MVYLTYTGISFGTEYTLLNVALSSIYIISSTIYANKIGSAAQLIETASRQAPEEPR